MDTPQATYRIQFHSKFTFQDAARIAGYLASLGISDIYASPILKARKDSLHGYDVIDPTQINPQLGGREGFERLSGHVKANSLGWIQDIVPNHMAFDSENRLLMDILEKGPLSKYYDFFDIQWDHPYPDLKHKVLAPFLGDLYGVCLDKNEIKLSYGEEGVSFRFYGWKFPLRIDCYPKVIGADLFALEQKMPAGNADYFQFLEIIHGFKNLANLTDHEDSYNFIALMKVRLWRLYSGNPILKEHVGTSVASFNGVPGDPQSFDKLDDLLSQQFFRLSYWKVGNEEINYRRFFTINGLISLKMEHQKTFDFTHRLVIDLMREGSITGLRIDHIDGLYNPLAYLHRLRSINKDAYLVVEKILDVHEALPANMPVQGTTGYDFMNTVNGVFIDRRSEKKMDRIYKSFTGLASTYRTLVRDNKRYFMGKYMAGDIDNLAILLKQILSRNRYGKDMTMYALRRAIVEIMANFPVYRAYMCEQETVADKIHVKEAVALAHSANPGLMHEIRYIGGILQVDLGSEISPQDKEAYYHFAKRFQQFSGALMAKSAEDTAFYIYNRFISLNEVGSDPSMFGLPIRDFHELMAKRQRLWPHALNASATHDTKRGEDVRARLNVLSQLPGEWERHLRAWNKINSRKKRFIHQLQLRAPHRNDEYFIYQTLIGTYPFGAADAAYAGRIKEYVIKAIRESQVNTTWSNPNHEYEEACVAFLEGILSDTAANGFLAAFMPFQRRVALRGIFNSLAQMLLKVTAPGIPDFYQGTELWDFSLVDPDNRRPVDYEQRMSMLKEMESRHAAPDFVSELLSHKEDGRIKMFLTFKALQARRRYKDLFLKGAYIALEVRGGAEDRVIAYARRLEGVWAITAVSRFSTEEESAARWEDTVLLLPADCPAQMTNILTGSTLRVSREVPLPHIFNPLSSTLLVSLP